MHWSVSIHVAPHPQNSSSPFSAQPEGCLLRKPSLISPPTRVWEHLLLALPSAALGTLYCYYSRVSTLSLEATCVRRVPQHPAPPGTSLTPNQCGGGKGMEGGQADVQRNRCVRGHSIPPVPPILSPDRSARGSETQAAHPLGSTQDSEKRGGGRWKRPAHLGPVRPGPRRASSLGLCSPTRGPAACTCARSSRRGPQRDARPGDFPDLGAGPQLSSPAAGAEAEPALPRGTWGLCAASSGPPRFARQPQAPWTRSPGTRGGSQTGRDITNGIRGGTHTIGYKIPGGALVGTWGTEADRRPGRSQSRQSLGPAAASLTSDALGPLCLHWPLGEILWVLSSGERRRENHRNTGSWEGWEALFPKCVRRENVLIAHTLACWHILFVLNWSDSAGEGSANAVGFLALGNYPTSQTQNIPTRSIAKGVRDCTGRKRNPEVRKRVWGC